MPPRGSNEILKALFRSKLIGRAGSLLEKDRIDTELVRTVSIARPSAAYSLGPRRLACTGRSAPSRPIECVTACSSPTGAGNLLDPRPKVPAILRVRPSP
jgi:hypothetical protein